jgi:hypothetical protein
VPFSWFLWPDHSGRRETANAAQLSLSGRVPGVTIKQLGGMFNWEPHTARTSISVASKWLGVLVSFAAGVAAQRA